MRAPLLLIAVCTLTCALGAQSYTVSAGTMPSAYADISSPTSTGLGRSQITNEITPAGFSFDYFGSTYTSFKVASSGYILMGGNSNLNSTTPSHGTAPGLVIAPLWTNLQPGGTLVGPASQIQPLPGTVSYQFAAGIGILSVEWKNVPVWGGGTSNDIGVRMKMLLDTTTGEIEFQYGSVPSNTNGATTNASYACAISGPVGAATQEVIAGAHTGYVGTNGNVSAYPANQYIRFTPTSAPTNNPPVLTVFQTFGQAAALVPDGTTLNVDYNDPLTVLGLGISTSDPDGDQISITTTITNLGSTGIQISEWESAAAAGPYTLTPNSGTFNTAAGVTHAVIVTASDGTASTVRTFNIAQAPQATTNTPPTISVLDTSGGPPPGIPYQDGQTLNVDYGDTVSSLSLGILVDDADADNTSVSATITNLGATGIQVSEWESTSAGVSYFLFPTSGTFNTPSGVTHVITLTADDGTNTTVFTFNIAQAPQTTTNTPPTINAQYDASFGGPPAMMPITNGSNVNVDFGQSVSGASFGFFIDDPDGDDCSVSTTITNLGGTGIPVSEWESASAPVNYSITPSTGNFNTVAGVTHVVTLTVFDGTDSTVLSFNIVQAAQPSAPSISVGDGSSVTPGQSAAGTNRAFGDVVVGTGPSAPLTITITNNGGSDLTLGTISISGPDAADFVLDTNGVVSPVGSSTTTSFTIAFDPTSTGAKSATVEIVHDDTTVSSPFTFEVTGNGTTSTPPGPDPTQGGGGGGGGGGCVACGGVNLWLLLLIAAGGSLGAHTTRRRAAR